jgi:hypothetical protein
MEGQVTASLTRAIVKIVGFRRLGLAVVVAVSLSAGGCGGGQSDAQQKCMDDFNARIGHDTSDNAFWQHLQDCARKNLLPAGQNDPGYYQ